MKSLKDYIKEEKDTTKEKELPIPREDIIFDIYETPHRKVKWLKDNFSYTKIEYKYYNEDKGIEIDFLLGYKGSSWRLWTGKIGIVSYDDQSYCDLKCVKFQDAIMNAIDKIEKFVQDVLNDPNNYVEYYIHL